MTILTVSFLQGVKERSSLVCGLKKIVMKTIVYLDGLETDQRGREKLY